MELKTPSKAEVCNILRLHTLYLEDEINGKCADFSCMNLTGFKFEGSKLHGADFNGATLNKCIFQNCELVGANFDHVEGNVALFNECDLDNTSWVASTIKSSLFVDVTAIGADMFDSELNGCMFLRSDMTEANLSNTNLDESEFADVNLESVIGNKTNIISMQVGGYDVVYTDTVLQIGKYRKPIEEWKELWKSKELNAADLHSEMHIADFVLGAIRFFPATPTITSEN